MTTIRKRKVAPKKQSLPGIPSELIRAAVDDLRALERDKKFLIQMTAWVEAGLDFDDYPHDREAQRKPLATCAVCFAGAVMARRLSVKTGGKKAIDTTPSDLSPVDRARINALNSFRRGEVYDALVFFGYSTVFITEVLRMPGCGSDYDDVHRLDREIPEYEDKPTEFQKQMLAIAKDLEAVGI